MGVSPRPRRGIGIYLLSDPIECTGTLVALNASGVCVHAEGANLTVMLRLYVYRQRGVNKYWRMSSNFITAECSNSTLSISRNDYSVGIVRNNSLSIPVSSGDFLGFLFVATCSEFNVECIFQPAVVRNTTKQLLYFSKIDGRYLKYGETKSNMSLMISATINRTRGTIIAVCFRKVFLGCIAILYRMSVYFSFSVTVRACIQDSYVAIFHDPGSC